MPLLILGRGLIFLQRPQPERAESVRGECQTHFSVHLSEYFGAHFDFWCDFIAWLTSS